MNADRRRAVREQDPRHLNAIDYLEIDPADETRLIVRFVFNLPNAPVDPVPAGAPGKALSKSDIVIEGGERIAGIKVVSVKRIANNELRVTVDRIGDFSVYKLRLRLPNGQPPPGFDPQLDSVDFVFHIECAKRFDCKARTICPPEFVPAPAIDYLAKDYPSFVRVMLDRLSLLTPRWTERHVADLGVALVETLAYVADHLSYRQDAIASEAYLGTARLRTSVRRHARLVDYRVGEGCNARVWLRVIMRADLAAGIPAGTRFSTLVSTQTAPHLENSYTAYRQAVLEGAHFFETMISTGALSVDSNEMALYAWSARETCLEVGATHATLSGAHPQLGAGSTLILAEKRGPRTGDTADADPAKRHAIRLVSPAAVGIDPLTGVAVTEIVWTEADALPFPLCIASITDVEHGETSITGVAVAWGNVVLADAGRTLGKPLDQVAPEPIGFVRENDTPRFRPRLAQSPITFAAPFAVGTNALQAMRFDAADATPSVTAQSTDRDGNVIVWSAIGDTLDAGVLPESPRFVVEVENDGTAYLRFGDGVNGLRPLGSQHFMATYRVGNGTSGNVGRETIVLLDTSAAVLATISSVTNPLPATGAVDPEPVEHVRQSAPVAFRTQRRAVTLSDYRDVARKFPHVRRAAATFRWTGSWTTVFVTAERSAGAKEPLAPAFYDYLDGYRLAGYDLEANEPQRVPLLLRLHVCVEPGYVATDVERAIREVFSDRLLPNGTLGMFHPDRFDLGAPLYLSPLIARAQEIGGVQSVTVERFEREGLPSDDGIMSGVLVPGRLEAFVLANNQDFPERGQFELNVDGGI